MHAFAGPGNAAGGKTRARPPLNGSLMIQTVTIHPVVLLDGLPLPGLTGPQRVARQRAMARRALARSAECTGIELPVFEKDADGAPLPAGGWHWSLSHKPEAAAAVIAPMPVGIDLETIRSVVAGLHRKIADDIEWRLDGPMADPIPLDTLFRFWTAKEAVLKRAGTGLRELSHCRVTAITDEEHMRLDLRGCSIDVRNLRTGKHIVAITDTGAAVQWHIEPHG